MKRNIRSRKLFTGIGNGGRTSLPGRQKVSKGSRRIDLLGELDELSAALGLARAATRQERSRSILLAVQRDVYQLMVILAVAGKAEKEADKLDPERVSWLEQQIIAVTPTGGLPAGFIVPGDTQAGAALDFARVTARRVERHLVRQVDRGRRVAPVILSYLNRISSLIFALELYELETEAIKPTLARS